MKQWLRIFSAVLCVCIMLLCGYMLYSGHSETERSNDTYGALRNAAQIMGQDMAGEAIELPEVDFKALREINSDIVAWIYSPDTAINYPVTQGEDNAYYLKRLFDRSYNNNGCIFLDFRNSPDFTDMNSILHGHHMQTEAMFSSIEGYKEQSYYEEHPVVYLITETTTYRVELFAGIVRKAGDIPQSFENGRVYLDYIKSLKEASTFYSDVEIAVSERLLTISTCVYDFKDARFMLAGKLVPLGK